MPHRVPLFPGDRRPRPLCEAASLRIQPDLAEALKQADAVVLAVKHQAYLKLDPGKVIKMTGRPVAIIDCFGILNDATIHRYFALGCEVKGLGRGHVKRIKDLVAAKK